MRFSTSLFAATILCVAGTTSLFAQSYSHVVAFGDSLSDRGNTVTLMDPLHDPLTNYGMEYDSVYYNADFSGYNIPAAGRFSSGPVWVEYLNAKILGGASATTPLDLGMNNGSSTTSTGTNYAWGGSLSGSGSYTPISGYDIHNLLTQVGNYQNNSALSPHAGSTLFTIWTGGNDALGWISDGADMDVLDTLTTTVINNIATAVTTLYAEGGRSFLLPNLPALGYKPNFIGTPNETAANAFVDLYNSKLAAWIDGAGLADAHLYELDVYSIFEDLRLNPGDYGFVYTDEAAYTYSFGGSTIKPDPELYLFWDNTHPTAQVHEILGYFAYQAIPEPSTYALAGIGCALGYWLRRQRRERLAA